MNLENIYLGFATSLHKNNALLIQTLTVTFVCVKDIINRLSVFKCILTLNRC